MPPGVLERFETVNGMTEIALNLSDLSLSSGKVSATKES